MRGGRKKNYFCAVDLCSLERYDFYFHGVFRSLSGEKQRDSRRRDMNSLFSSSVCASLCRYLRARARWGKEKHKLWNFMLNIEKFFIIMWKAGEMEEEQLNNNATSPSPFWRCSRRAWIPQPAAFHRDALWAKKCLRRERGKARRRRGLLNRETAKFYELLERFH